MTMTKQELWLRFQQHYTDYPDLGLALDVSRMNFKDDFLPAMEPRIQSAFAAMAKLEKGAVANPDEKRMVGHYWLRNASLAPTPAIRAEIEQNLVNLKTFAAQVHEGTLRGARGPFKNLLLIGIGGSALGPQFVAHALGQPAKDKLTPHFFDNTDPDGMDRVLSKLGSELGQTLCVVVSKSGGTQETRNGMLEAEAAYKLAGLAFSSHAVAITSQDSQLDKYASQQGWLTRFPMWDWVGGRTSELSAVGLLPAALQGFDIEQLLAGARACDDITRIPNSKTNPSAQLALMWFHAGNGKGLKNMVILPYKDRLELFSKYLQQLVMESLGKHLDLAGTVVNQGLTVFGNKGSTDQHAYVQQLRDGLDDFFITFIEVLQDRAGSSLEVAPYVTAGDYLIGFLQGTRSALYENKRESVTITLRELTPFAVGLLIALFERAVGFYASLINVNAYHQPGVEAGKKAASNVIDLQLRIIRFLEEHKGMAFSATEIATKIGAREDVESVLKICEHLAANADRQIVKSNGTTPFDGKYRRIQFSQVSRL
jgi:glucose-6-phosphate isomerase